MIRTDSKNLDHRQSILEENANLDHAIHHFDKYCLLLTPVLKNDFKGEIYLFRINCDFVLA